MLQWLEDALKPKGQNIAFGRLAHELENVREPPKVDYEKVSYDPKPIGTGSFGAVYQGTYEGCPIAVKDCMICDKAGAEMLVQEIRHLQKLDHPRLVSFLGCFRKPQHVFIVMEFCPGGSLHEKLFGLKKWTHEPTFKEKVRKAWQVSEGLTYLHERRVVHRDLKTMNIILDPSDECKICDFGLMITLAGTHLTNHQIQGSPRYMAPEQFQAGDKLTEKVDIWAIGCVMFELFFVKTPFQKAENFAQIASELLVRRRPPAIPITADPRARALVQACLRLPPQMRPPAECLEEALRGAMGSPDSEDD